MLTCCECKEQFEDKNPVFFKYLSPGEPVTTLDCRAVCPPCSQKLMDAAFEDKANA